MNKTLFKFLTLSQALIFLFIASFSIIIHLPDKNDNSNDTHFENSEDDSFPESNTPSLPELPQSDNNIQPDIFPEDKPGIPAIPLEPAPIRKQRYLQVKSNSLNVRSGASTKNTIIGSLKRGDTVPMISELTNGWFQTIYKNRTAYVKAEKIYTDSIYITISQNVLIETVIQEGMNLLGYPYIYGAIRVHDGTGRKIKHFNAKQFDCSSLMQYIFYKGAGINLNMTTRTQIKQGQYVPKSKIRRGDLLFFTNSARRHKHGIERVGHVALYLGDNRIYHTSSTYALIEEISPQRHRDYIEARRIIL